MGGAAALIAVFAIMIILLAVLALVVVNALAESPWGTFSIAMTIPIALLHGLLPPRHPSGAGQRGLPHRRRAAAARDRRGQLGRGVLARGHVHAGARHPGHLDGRLRVRRIRTARMDAARAARLPLDVHEDRHHRAARPRRGRRPADHEDGRGHRLRLQRRRAGLRRVALPVRLHHHRLRRPVRLPRPDLLGHDPEDDPEGDAGPDDRLRLHADGVVRRGDGDGRGLHHRPGALLRDERPGGCHRRLPYRPLRKRSAISDTRSRPKPSPPPPRTSRSSRCSPVRAGHRRSRSGSRRSSPKSSAAQGRRRSGTTSRSCSRPCSSSPRSTRAPAWAGSCCRTPSATSTSRSAR